MQTRRALLLAVVLINVLLLVMWRLRGVSPKPHDAPPREFSSARAKAVLDELLQEGVPHPIGTAANRRIRDRIVARFRALGYETRIQQRFTCSPSATCATVENIIAEAPGQRRNGETLLLAVHYDSVAAGPGASDDGTGVASLIEIARAVRGEQFRNRVVFLVDDGEEAGLLGAEAFIADAGLSQGVTTVINLENRGTSGASYMFETSRRNRWLIAHLGRGVQTPAATSLFYTIYDLLPNDTDVTIFKRAGKAAVNFAAIGNVAAYHTPNDDLAHVDLRTLQHHGDNVLGMLRQLGNADIAVRTADNAVYFDLLGLFLVQWPEGWTLWIAIVSMVLLIAGVRTLPPRAMTFGVLSFFGAVIVALVAGAAVSWLARLRDGGATWVATPAPAITAMWITGIAAALLSVRLLRPYSTVRALLAGHAIVWHAAAIALGATLPGPSYVFVVPAVAFTLLFLFRASDTAIAAVVSAIAALLLFPLGAVLYEALGAPGLAMVALLIGIFATTFTPVVELSVRGVGAVFAVAAICALVALALPAYTPDRPQPLSLAYIDDEQRGTIWTAAALTPTLQSAARFAEIETPADWLRRPRFAAAAPRLPLARVEATGTRTADRLTLRVHSPRGADRIALIYRTADVTAVRVNGLVPPPIPERDLARRRASALQSVTVYAPTADIELTTRTGAPIELRVGDVAYGLPPEGTPLLRARGAAAAPIATGDVSITQRRVKM